MEHDFTRGNILKTIAVFALPYMLSYFLQMLYGMADLYMMGQFSGAAGITAVGNGAQTLYIITVTLVGLVEKMISFLFIVPSAMGTTVSALTAQNAGAGKGARARQVLRCAMTISVVYGCLITVLMWLVAPAFIGFFAKGPAVIAAGTGYMHSYIFDAIFAGIHICLSGFFAAYGKSLHRLCAQRAGRGAHSRARCVAAVECLFRYVVSHGHRLAMRIDFVGSHLCCRVYRAQPARGF